MAGEERGQPAAAGPWWRRQAVPAGQTLDCRLGPLSLQVYHGAGEWQVAVSYEEEGGGEGNASLGLRPGGIEGESYERFVCAAASAELVLLPMLADRPVVIRPRQPVFLLSGEETTMYLSSPVSLRLMIGEPGVLLREVPMLRLSDTWFGPSTQVGELCYAGKTQARHSLAELPRRVHRALTPLHIRNEGNSPLPLDKISLPVPFLSVYGAEDASLWTQKATLIRRSDSDMAVLKVDAVPPAYAGPVTLVSGPRQAQGRSGIVRAFNVLFGEGR